MQVRSICKVCSLESWSTHWQAFIRVRVRYIYCLKVQQHFQLVKKWWLGKPIAAYRDDSGEIHLMSPVCTHLGCVVSWNPLEKTWDCPCHGGRYNALGKRMYGPPPQDLECKDFLKQDW